jgi:hypothetical protein
MGNIWQSTDSLICRSPPLCRGGFLTQQCTQGNRGNRNSTTLQKMTPIMQPRGLLDLWIKPLRRLL